MFKKPHRQIRFIMSEVQVYMQANIMEHTINKGWLNLPNINKKRHEKCKSTYDQNPRKCKFCGKTIQFEKRQNIFCNSSCAATLNNKGKCRNKTYYDILKKTRQEPVINKIIPKTNKPELTTYCYICGKKVKGRKSKFCKNAHAILYKTGLLIESGKATHHNKRAVRRYLIHYKGNVCEYCKRRMWRGQPIPLDMHHIDGDVENMKLDNLLLLCPICHTQTPNYKSKNKNGHTNRKTYQKKEHIKYFPNINQKEKTPVMVSNEL